MRRSLIIAGSILVVLAAVVIAVPFVVDLGDYRQRLEDMAKSVTGRSLRIEGPIRVTLFPHLGIKAETVALANMPGGRAAAMARANDIQLSIRLIPLLFGRVEVDRIVLERPVIALEVDKGGASNWSLGGNNPKPGGTSVTLPSSTLFSGVTVQDGDITYDNYKSSSHYAFEHVNADVALTRLDQPIQVDGNLALAGRQVDFHADVATVQKLLSNGTTTLGLTLKSDAFEASLKGSVAPDGRVDGDATFNTASLRSAAGLFGEKLPAGDSFGLARFRSHVVVENRIATLSPMLLALDGQSITGDLTFDETGAVTIVSGALQADRLDLNPFFPTRRRAPVAAGWSREPLDLSMLRDVDARLSLTADALRLRQLRLGRTVTQFRLDNGALTARLEPVSLYGGTGRVELELQCTASVPAVKSSLAFEHVALRPFLNDALGIDSIDGSGTLNLTIAGEGDNAFAIMHSLSGSGAIAAADGRVRGVDLGAVSRTIQAVLNTSATSSASSTPFHDLGGTFTIAKGVLSNRDFHIDGPIVQMTGSGQLDIGNRGIDFHVTPKGGVGRFKIGIPFHITGSWDHVHYAPDMAGMVSGALQGIGSGVSPLNGLLGGGNQSTPPKTKKSQKSPVDTLTNIFGGH